MQPQGVGFWQALGEYRIPWFFSNAYMKPALVWWLAGVGSVVLIAALLLALYRRHLEPEDWTAGHTVLLFAIFFAFVFGMGPAVVVTNQPQRLLQFLGVKSLFDLSPWGVTLVIRALQSLTYLAWLGFLSVSLGTVALWQDKRLLEPYVRSAQPCRDLPISAAQGASVPRDGGTAINQGGASEQLQVIPGAGLEQEKR